MSDAPTPEWIDEWSPLGGRMKYYARASRIHKDQRSLAELRPTAFKRQSSGGTRDEYGINE